MTRRTRLNQIVTSADVRYPAGIQTSIPVVAGAEVASITGVQSAVGTARIPYYAVASATDLCLVYNNWTNNATQGDIIPSADLVLSAGVEYGGNTFQVTFGGKTSVTINPGGLVISDPIAVPITAGQFVYVRTYTSGTGWYPNHRGWAGPGGGGGWTVTSNLTTTGSASIPDSLFGTYMLGPCAILGTPTATNGARVPTVLGVGDSIMSSTGDFISTHAGINTVTTNLGGSGFLGRAAVAAGFGYINIGIPSDQANSWFYGGGSPGGHIHRGKLSRFCRTAIMNYSTNDVYAGQTLAQVQASLIAIWNYLSGKGLRVFQTTMLPRCSASSDGWKTTTNQTVGASESVRVALNGWIRDGAPMSSGAAVTTGTAGASRAAYFTGNTVTTAASGAAHPLYGLVETADSVESSRNSGLWSAATNLRTVTDGVATSGSNTVTSATAAFTSADLGRAMSIAGAGAAGALYVSNIYNNNSATSAAVLAQPGTTVSGASMSIYQAATLDGIHPSQWMHQAIAAALPTNYFI